MTMTIGDDDYDDDNDNNNNSLICLSPMKKKTCLKTVEKLSKYKDLEIEIEITWKLETMTVPVLHRCSRDSQEGD